MAMILVVDSEGLTPTSYNWSIVNFTLSCTVFELFVIFFIMGFPMRGLKMEAPAPSSLKMETFPMGPPKGTSFYRKASIDTACALVWSVNEKREMKKSN